MNANAHEAPRRGLLREVSLLLGCLALALGLLWPLGIALHGLGLEQPGRMARRILVPLFIALYLGLGRFRRAEFLAAVGTGYLPVSSALRTYFRGWAIGVVSLLALVLLTFALQRWEWRLHEDGAKTLRRVLGGVFTGVVLVVLEESLFRGILQHRLRRAGGALAAVGLGSFLFSAAHFLRPDKARPAYGWENALDAPLGCLAALGSIPQRLDEFAGLFLVGAVLATVRLSQRNLLLVMGLHAGWYYVRLIQPQFLISAGDEVRPPDWLTGTSRFYDGLLGQVIMAAALLALLLRRGRAARLTAED